MTFPHKKEVSVTVILKPKKIFLCFEFKQRRRKFLKNRRKFFCSVFSGQLTLEATLKDVFNWLEKTNEDALLQELEDSPSKYLPAFYISESVRLDFNVTEETVIGETFNLQLFP